MLRGLLIIDSAYYVHIRPMDLKIADHFTGVIGNTGNRSLDAGPLGRVHILDCSQLEEEKCDPIICISSLMSLNLL